MSENIQAVLVMWKEDWHEMVIACFMYYTRTLRCSLLSVFFFFFFFFFSRRNRRLCLFNCSACSTGKLKWLHLLCIFYGSEACKLCLNYWAYFSVGKLDIPHMALRQSGHYGTSNNILLFVLSIIDDQFMSYCVKMFIGKLPPFKIMNLYE